MKPFPKRAQPSSTPTNPYLREALLDINVREAAAKEAERKSQEVAQAISDEQEERAARRRRERESRSQPRPPKSRMQLKLDRQDEELEADTQAYRTGVVPPNASEETKRLFARSTKEEWETYRACKNRHADEQRALDAQLSDDDDEDSDSSPGDDGGAGPPPKKKPAVVVDVDSD